jgi:hypothetical protein
LPQCAVVRAVVDFLPEGDGLRATWPETLSVSIGAQKLDFLAAFHVAALIHCRPSTSSGDSDPGDNFQDGMVCFALMAMRQNDARDKERHGDSE